MRASLLTRPAMLVAASPQQKAPSTNVTFVTNQKPMLNDKTMFQNYMVGVDGACEIYDPPLSYWCSEHPSGGGAFAFRAPSGLKFDPATALKRWANPDGAIVNVWRQACTCINAN